MGTKGTRGFQRTSWDAGTALRMIGLSDEVEPTRYNPKGQEIQSS